MHILTYFWCENCTVKSWCLLEHSWAFVLKNILQIKALPSRNSNDPIFNLPSYSFWFLLVYLMSLVVVWPNCFFSLFVTHCFVSSARKWQPLQQLIWHMPLCLASSQTKTILLFSLGKLYLCRFDFGVVNDWASWYPFILNNRGQHIKTQCKEESRH